ncbi:bifunctional phosphopantothenoylcysteine decarboxylase/phosphopantothenate--cysteine ligase CoaBC [Anaerolineales bacterium HSG24]|nr:bifunctional phosphopantothenoylcysteine decarboxylase/phosphopantothenate--cysteine ligase CoaBC [Anaerolineales bacterium HSG24]
MSNILAYKHIILGVTGGIAAYKAAILCSRLVQAGATVDVVMTEAAQRFISPLTFQALTHRRVYLDMFNIPSEENIPHITLADQANLLIIAPATANTLAKLANGLADNLLTAIALATHAPILVAPAMETDMWQHPATQANLTRLKAWGATLAGPAEGRLASGAVGRGRMVEPDEIVETARILLAETGDLANCKLVVTAGGTREAIDPVRFIGNHSTGKMGYAIAHAARDRGASVTLITTASLPPPLGVKLIKVASAQQMRAAVLKAIRLTDVLVMSAAVADFRPATVAEQKIKKKADSSIGLSIDLVRTSDILADVAVHVDRPRVTVGFAAESENLLDNAESKLKRKNLDMIAANNISATDAGFGVDTNRVTLLFADGTKNALPLMSKRSVAEIILDNVVDLLCEA